MPAGQAASGRSAGPLLRTVMAPQKETGGVFFHAAGRYRMRCRASSPPVCTVPLAAFQSEYLPTER